MSLKTLRMESGRYYLELGAFTVLESRIEIND